MVSLPHPADLSDEAFRARWRAWLAEHVPAEFRDPFIRLSGDDALRWTRLLSAYGWRAPAWPRESGGMGLQVEKQIIYQEELDRLRVARTIDLGVGLLGPTLMRFGTEAQQQRYLPAMLSGDEVWCQGYSEPNAGSDLASLQTRAWREADTLVITGQKIWVTHAMFATHIFLLVRTSNEGPRQAGITFVLVDLQSPGIRVRPISNLTGEAEFAEVFFDEVKVPVANVVGEIDKGWAVTQALLGTERLGLGSPVLANLALDAFDDATNRLGASSAAVTASRQRFHLELQAIRCLYRDAGRALSAGRDIGRELPMLKLASSELLQRITEALVGLGVPRIPGSGEGAAAIDPAFLFLIARPTTIFGGTSEIQRNILAKHLLRLPGS